MTPPRAPTRGRPPAASRELLQEAAFELFIENGYTGTTVDQIATRAGVSRNTFFNYFDAKGEVFWVELDAATERLRAALADQPTDTGDAASALLAIRQAMLRSLAELESRHVPFVLTQYDLIGSATELQASAMSRFATQARLLSGFLERHGVDAATARTQAYALIACVVSAAQEWANAGPRRGRLEPFVHRAFDTALAPLSPHDR
ncbi:TetR family transcriptional regulator [Salinibacterium sp. NG22]|uniref:TetR/AcrR family transcriptional regulator n=1 Tax=Salinibacterium sp. NG22 TaxID=2792040 RepID=UPI0018CF0FFB|nr:TetR/AcrR family transcriptional regulator [Salinibacterium sp. NG22]MBH0109105.1 TetR family transcriptional regulator [Salinibacterium sp. NG22]